MGINKILGFSKRKAINKSQRAKVDNLLGGYSDGAPPLPIPNREVKPICADGTAYNAGE